MNIENVRVSISNRPTQSQWGQTAQFNRIRKVIISLINSKIDFWDGSGLAKIFLLHSHRDT